MQILTAAWVAQACDGCYAGKLSASDTVLLIAFSRGIPGVLKCLTQIVRRHHCIGQVKSMLSAMLPKVEATIMKPNEVATVLRNVMVHLEMSGLSDTHGDTHGSALTSLTREVSVPPSLGIVLSASSCAEFEHRAHTMCLKVHALDCPVSHFTRPHHPSPASSDSTSVLS